MALYRAKFGRLLALDEKIRRGEYPNCTTFAREWEVSTKSIQRDVEFLRDSLGAPIEYDPDRRGFSYTDAGWRLGPIELSESDLLQLAVAERMAAQYRGTPISPALERLFEKLRSALPGKTRIDPIDVHARFSFHGHPVREVPKAIWRTVARALRDGRLFRVAYRRYGASTPRNHAINPVHLASLDGEWMLVGQIRGRDDLTLFALSRMEHAALARGPAERVAFDPEQFFANRFARFVGGSADPHEIIVRFSAQAAPGVLERTWHPRQTLLKQADGTVVLRFPAPALFEVQRWALQWGGDAEVLGPPELRRAVAREATRLRALYCRRRVTRALARAR